MKHVVIGTGIIKYILEVRDGRLAETPRYFDEPRDDTPNALSIIVDITPTDEKYDSLVLKIPLKDLTFDKSVLQKGDTIGYVGTIKKGYKRKQNSKDYRLDNVEILCSELIPNKSGFLISADDLFITVGE